MSDIITKIRKVQKQKHDTLYCNKRIKRDILMAANSSTTGLRADNVRIAGLDVITHERFNGAIVCERGEVFTTTKDYKYNQAEPINI